MHEQSYTVSVQTAIQQTSSPPLNASTRMHNDENEHWIDDNVRLMIERSIYQCKMGAQLKQIFIHI